MTRDWLVKNRDSWVAAAVRHLTRRRDLAEMIGRRSCFIPDEIRVLLDVLDDQLVWQPFCNDGRELLDLIGENGKGVGVDFVPEMVRRARDAASCLHRNCEFHCAEVSEWLLRCRPRSFDCIFLSPGSMWWIDDLASFCRETWRVCKHGGCLLAWEFHPLVHTLDDGLNVTRDYPFDRVRRVHAEGICDYDTGPAQYRSNTEECLSPRAFGNSSPVTDFLWGLGPILRHAATAGWRLEHFCEYPTIFGERYLPALTEVFVDHFGAPAGRPKLPLTFSLLLRKCVV